MFMDHEKKDKGEKRGGQKNMIKENRKKKKKKNKNKEGPFLTNPPSEKFVWWQALVLGLVKNCPKEFWTE